ncbi:MAG: TonB-dependent receptor [Bacteroidales bacterium]
MRLFQIISTGIIFFILSAFTSSAQQCVNGRVVDATSKKPLQGVAVFVRGTGLGVTTDSLGQFKICSSGKPIDALVFSHLGYSPCEYKLTSPLNPISIEMATSSIRIEQVVITATLTPQKTWDVPALVSVIDSVGIKSEPATNVDNLLRTIPGLFVSRSSGVYSKNASVTMRGLDGSNRVLILYDGAPLNKTSYGFINWSLISPDMVDQVEVVHGPSSALFGNNAMAGVINIRTKYPIDSPFYGSITGETGSFDLYGARVMLGGKIPLGKKDVKVLAYGFWREGDGYIADTPNIGDSTSVAMYLKEKGASVKLYIPVSDSASFFVGGNLYDDKRGGGRSVYMDDGSYDSYTTQRFRFGYNGNVKGFMLDIYGFVQREVYDRQNESLNETGDTYRLYYTDQVSGDLGLWANASKLVATQNTVTVGVDLKHGWMDAGDTYRTSTDYIERDGKVTFGALFVQDEQALFDKKVRVLGGLRLDYARFFNGYLRVDDPTKATGFQTDTISDFPASSWVSVNPKLGIRYLPASWLSVYGSVSSGFMPAKLDDLCSSRKITKGFKLANPGLKPEHLLTYEIGGGFTFGETARLDAAFYLSDGKDFQYFVSTGDSIDTGGTELKPFVKRQNIAGVRIYGSEISLKVNPLRWMLFKASYSFNHSKITSYDANILLNVDLTGKKLAEVPLEQASAELYITNKYINAGILWTYIGKQWGDEINSYKNDSWNTFDMRIWQELGPIKATLDIFDIFDNPYTDKKGLMSPGRFFQLAVSYSFR